MNIGVTKIMDRSRQGLKENAVHSAGGSSAANTCSNVPLDNARAVAMETTPNPLSYWPPPSLPSANVFKEAVDDPQIRAPDTSHSSAVAVVAAAAAPGAEVSKECNNPRKETPGVKTAGPDSPAPPAAPKVLHHNLPPIAGITSSHNYREARETQKNGQGDLVEHNRTPTAGVTRSNGHVTKLECDDPAGAKVSAGKPDVNPADSNRQKTENLKHSFSAPTTYQKVVPTTRALTPFVHVPGDKVPSFAGESLTYGFNSSSSAPGSIRAVRSQHFVAPGVVTTSTTVGTVQPVSSSENLRSSSSPHSPHLSSLISTTHKMSNLKVLPAMGAANHLQPNNTQPCSQQVGSSMPYLPNSQSTHPSVVVVPNVSDPRCIQPDSSRSRSAEDSQDGKRTPQELFQHSPSSKYDFSSINRTSITNSDAQQNAGLTCKNPFDLPANARPFAQQNHIQHNNQNYQQQQTFGFNKHAVTGKQPLDSGSKMPQGSRNYVATGKDHYCRTAENNFYPVKMADKQHNSPAVCGKDFRVSESLHKPEETGQRPVTTSQHSDAASQPDNSSSKEVQIIGTKSVGVVGSVAWTKTEPGVGFRGSRNVTQNVNKNRGFGNEYPNAKMSSDLNYEENEFRNMKGHFKLTVDKKEGPRFPPVPQSNYDLKRQIYDTMTGANKNKQQQQPPQPPQQLFRPVEREAQGVSYAKNHSDLPGISNLRPIHVEKAGNSTGDASLIEYSTPNQEVRMNSYAQYHKGLVDSPNPGGGAAAYQKKKFLSSIDQHATPVLSSQVPLGLDHHRTSRLPAGRQHQVVMRTQYLQADEEPKATGAPLLSTPQSGAADMMMGGHPLTSRPGSGRPKRESPLDLSVKTVRQSADSTAKDDGEIYFQNLDRNLNQTCHSEGRFPAATAQLSDAGAPKIDFTPNFSGFHMETSPPSTPSHHKPEMPVLPPLESFKKFPGRLSASTAVQDTRNKCEIPSSATFYSQRGTSAGQRVPQTTGRQPDHLKPEFQKRVSNSIIRNHAPQAKIPKIDSWKLAFDEQIEQRLNSARANLYGSQSAAEFAVDKVDSAKSSSVQNCSNSKHGGGPAGRHKGTTNMYLQIPVQTSATPYNPAYVQQQPQCQPATPQTPQEKIERLDNVGHLPDPEQIIKQISKGVMPDYKLLQDKNVLSILRSSLEEKEAKLMQLREAARRKEKHKEMMVSEGFKKRFQPYEQMPPKPHGDDKQSLPPFGALTLERMSAPPSVPGHRLNAIKTVDSIKIDIEPVQKYLGPGGKTEMEKGGIPKLDPSPHDDAQGPPTDLDGLAAFLAARIRTKGELKQVGPTVEHEGSLSNRDQSCQSSEEFSRLQSCHTIKSPNHISSGNPPKLVRETRLMTPLRRRLFSHAEEETATTSSQKSGDFSLASRDPNGIRSSSETSVFDFRESDSEGEMPVLERQTLEGMRRDRKTFGSKQNVSAMATDEPSESEKPDVIIELDKSHPDPFWDTAFDMFVEQLEKRPPKRSVKRRKVCNRTPYAGPEMNGNSKYETSENKTGNGFSECAVTDDDDDDDDDDVDEEDLERVKEGVKVEIKQEVDKDSKDQSETSISCQSSDRLKSGETASDVGAKEKRERSGGKCLKNVNAADREKRSRIDADSGVKKGSSEKVSDKCQTKVKTRRKGEAANKEDVTESDKTDKKKQTVDTTSDDELDDLDVIDDDDDDDDDEVDEDDEEEDVDEDDNDDDSLSLSGLESESTDSDESSESSVSNYSSAEESENEGCPPKKRTRRMQTRLQTRSSKQKQIRTTGGMRLRSKAVSAPVATAKTKNKKRLRRRRRHRRKRRKKEEFYPCGKRKKPSFGDGSHFRPGWEEECYKFKQQLRMPEKLISISIPPKRSSASLPDLDPYRNSPSLDSSDVSIGKKGQQQAGESEESDPGGGRKKQKLEVTPSTPASDDTCLKSRNGKKSQSNSILNMLVKKYGRSRAGKKEKDLDLDGGANDRKSPKILPKATNKPELLPTPSLGIGKENVLTNKKRQHQRETGKRKLGEDGEEEEDDDSHYLGCFRKKTINNFKEAFKQNVGILSQELSPTIIKSRTRTQARDLKKKTTLIEVFGEERPASAPPLGRDRGGAAPQEEKMDKDKDKGTGRKKGKPLKKVGGGVVTRGRGKLMRSGRPGLRSTAVLRSNKAVHISKRHLNSGRKRNAMDLLRIRAMASKKAFSYLVTSSESAGQMPTMTKKRLKLRSVRRKFRSGFDYIRKKKKLKKDGDSADGSVKERKLPVRSTSENVEDIQNEIKNWVINKGLGETILHRAARLGYTDVAAYCLEKLECSPSPRDNAGYTPLHEACSRGHLEIAKLLLMYGASVSESAKGGIRPLHEAAENGFTELIRLLLSFGADPLLETYTGHTALSLVTDEEARRLIQYHLADVQGNVAPVWTFQGPSSLFDPLESGYDPLSEPPSPEPKSSDTELEISDSMLPPLYRLTTDADSDRHWVLLRDLLTYTKLKTKEAILKQVEASSVREMKLSDFHEQGRCCNLLNVDRLPVKASKVVLVCYDDRIRRLLDVERVLL